MKIRTAIASGAIALTALTAGVGIGSASASGFPLFQTANRVERLVSPTCYHVHSVTKTYYHWSKEAGRYVPYAGGPHQTVSDYTHCHS